MPDDERAFLAAITAAPADDTVRLVYADWLDEHGQPTRAEFIRAQIEAETLHRHSPRREELELRAEKLLAGHWVEWWSPVCESVGLPPPASPPASRLGRFARALGVGKSAGHPFALTRLSVHAKDHAAAAALGGVRVVEFRRGFPEYLRAYAPGPTGSLLADWPFLSQWTEYPLARLRLTGVAEENWFSGPHLAGVSALELDPWRDEDFTSLLRSQQLTSLQDLTLVNTEWVGHAGVPSLFALSRSSFASRLKRLSVPVFDDDAAAALAEGFGNLTALGVEFDLDRPVIPPHEMGRRLVRLGASPRLAGLRELDLVGGFLPHAVRDATGVGNWTNLRRLSIDFRYAQLPHLELPDPAAVPALEDLSIAGVWGTPRTVHDLVASPLTKQLRYFALTLWRAESLGDDDWRRLADVVDPGKIETFWLDADHTTPGIHLLRQRLGDKLRTPS